MNYILLVLGTIIIGTLFYYIMESSIPKKSNCSFISNIWVDILAFIGGFVLIYKGIRYKDHMIIIIGGSIIVEHIWQLLPKYTLSRML